MATSASSGRVNKLLELARRLEDRLLLNTSASRADCRVLALEILELLDDEDRDRQPDVARFRPEHRATIQRLVEAMQECREAGEQAALTRLFVASEREHCTRR